MPLCENHHQLGFVPQSFLFFFYKNKIVVKIHSFGYMGMSRSYTDHQNQDSKFRGCKIYNFPHKLRLRMSPMGLLLCVSLVITAKFNCLLHGEPVNHQNQIIT